jgi:nucleoside-diphosphate-sugar epimerase
MSSTKPLVLLTGGNGFVGAHVLDHLLKSNYRVRATVRSSAKSQFFEEKYADRKDDLSFIIVPNIEAPNALDEAVKDVEYICHVASPYFTATNDPLKELMEPAVGGTKNVISSALKANKLKRITVLSSFASVVDLTKNPRAGYVYTDKDWDPVTWEKGQEDGYWGYHASKTFAEKAAWEMHKEHHPNWDLVTFCPPMIYGPPIHEVHAEKGIAGLNTSL